VIADFQPQREQARSDSNVLLQKMIRTGSGTAR
jgi:hypothetical protein